VGGASHDTSGDLQGPQELPQDQIWGLGVVLKHNFKESVL